jgi:hypothetical protein
MSIRFPKRNIAQAQAIRNLKPQPKPEEENFKLISIEEPIKELIFHSPGLNNTLYPIKLYRMHEDLEALGRMYQLPTKEREELRKRLPASLAQAEAKADKLLEEFVRTVIKQQSQAVYMKHLKEAMNPKVQIMLALRCWIAACTVDGPKNSINIYHNKVMEAWDFFPKSARKDVVDPITGEPFIFIDYESENPFERQNVVKSEHHHEIARIDEPGPRKIDYLPKDWSIVMEEVLTGFGIEVKDIDHAWKQLDKVSKEASIEDRIVSKIAYLITHATIHRKIKTLPSS